MAVLRAVQERLIVPPARLNPGVSAALEAAVMRALERERARRWPSAQELERSLAEVVLGGARSLEDTDVGAFVRRMFPEEAGVAEPLPGTGSIPISLSTSAPPAAGPREASPSVPVTSPQPTELVTPPPAEPGPTDILPRAAPLRRRVAGVLALAALAAAATLAVRAGPGLLTRERERPGTPPARDTLGAEQPAASPVRPPPASGSVWARHQLSSPRIVGSRYLFFCSSSS